MSYNDIAIKAKNLSKIYRIGMKENMSDSFGGAIIDCIKSPLKNYHKYRSLYKFKDIDFEPNYGQDSHPNDIIWALKDVSFKVKIGEVVGIIGRNGAGKSTLLKILSKITDPTKGYAEIRGRVSSLLEVGTGFHPELTGRENIYLNGTILGMSKKEVERKFDEIVMFSGVEKFIDTPVKRYSSGMSVRLAFSVAAHLEPEILIIDEVLAVGDAEFQKKCLNKMENAGQQGRTVLFVSHNMPAIARLCERTILLNEGRVMMDGPSAEIVSNYLTSGLGTMAAREWGESAKAPGSNIVRLRAVRVLSESGRICETINIRNKFIIEMEYDVLSPGHILLPHFGLVNEQGQDVFITVDRDPEWRRRARPAGHYNSKVLIPGNLLAEGMFFVSCYALTLDPDVLQFGEHSTVAFNVVDSHDGDSARGDYVKNMPGVVRPMLDWSTEFDPFTYENQATINSVFRSG
jgi:lipopolysaccharide transport system ATP-binding protein